MIVCFADLEMNQPSNKIIEIGAAVINLKTGQILDDFAVLVNPEERIDWFIRNFTGITQRMIDDRGVLLPEALQRFWVWSTQYTKKIGAWGNDHLMIFDQSQAVKVPNCPKKLNGFDLFETAGILRCAFPQSKAKGGLQNTLELFGLPFVGIPHRARVDAYNTAMLAYRFVQQIRGFHTLSKMLDEMVKARVDAAAVEDRPVLNEPEEKPADFVAEIKEESDGEAAQRNE